MQNDLKEQRDFEFYDYLNDTDNNSREFILKVKSDKLYIKEIIKKENWFDVYCYAMSLIAEARRNHIMPDCNISIRRYYR